MGLARTILERRAGGFGVESSAIPGPLDGTRTNAGPRVTEDSSLGHIDVFKCVSLIADAVAQLPLRAYRNEAVIDGNGNTRVFAKKLGRQPLILTDPMPGDLAPEFSFKHRVMSSLLTAGDTFNEIAAIDAQGVPSVAMPIHPSKVRKVDLDRAGRIVYEMHDGGVLGNVRDGGTMFHFPGFVRAGSLTGLSPIAAGMQGIALSMAAEEFGSRWFGDGAHPSGYLSNKEQVEEAEAKATKAKWMQAFGGLSREPAYLYGGLEWTPIQVNPEESQFIETRKMQTSQIASLYRIPPHLVGETDRSTSWGTGIEEQGIGFVVFTLGPWLARFEQAISFLLPRGQFAKFNVGALLRGNIANRYAAYAVGRQWGWLSVNDIRELEDLSPLPDGDMYLQPLNMIEASEALALLMSNKTEPAAEPDLGAEDE